MLFSQGHQTSHCCDFRTRPRRYLLHPIEHEDNPLLPVAGGGYLRQQTVVVVLVLNDVAAQIEDWQSEQLLFNQVQYVDDAASPSITIMKGVNGFELIMTDSHFDQWICVVLCVQIVFTVSEQVTKDCLPDRWCVNSFSGHLIANNGAGNFTNIHLHALQGAAYFHDGIGA